MNSFTDISFGCPSVPVRSLECPQDIHFNSIENRLLMTKMTEGSEGTDQERPQSWSFLWGLYDVGQKENLWRKDSFSHPSAKRFARLNVLRTFISIPLKITCSWLRWLSGAKEPEEAALKPPVGLRNRLSSYCLVLKILIMLEHNSGFQASH